MRPEKWAPSFVADLPVTRAALERALAAHSGQRRADGAPFVLHPLEVASLLHNAGYPDETVAVGVLHDVVEDTNMSVDQLRSLFGERVARLVESLTEDPSIDDRDVRKHRLRGQVEAGDPAAHAVFAADKVAKTRELRARLTHASRDDGGRLAARLRHYVASLEMLERVLPSSPLVRQLRFELEALHALPPEGADAVDPRLSGGGCRCPRR